jgi:glycerate-2-kinase
MQGVRVKMIREWLSALSRRAFIAAEKPEMSSEDRCVIVAFAKGADELRSKAIEIHRANIDKLGMSGNIFQCFMAEVDNPVPDYAQRHAYRQAVLKITA